MVEVLKIIIADDHPLVREALKNTLCKEQDFKVIAEASDGEVAVKLANELNPDIVIMDIGMPKLDGLEATRRIKTKNANIGVLALTVHDNEEFMYKMIQAGADGYLTKSVLGSEIIFAIRALWGGEMVLSPPTLKKLLTYSNRRIQNEIRESNLKFNNALTIRELEILKLVAQGDSNKDIALRLGLSVRTIKGHLLTIFARLNAKSRTEAVVIGLRKGILTINDVLKQDIKEG